MTKPALGRHKYLDTGKPEWIEMKPVLDVVKGAKRGQTDFSAQS